MKKILYCILLILPLPLFARAEEYQVLIQDHKFVPETITVPAGKKIKLLIKNNDNEIEEFESFDLKREKIIVPNGSIVINIGPLAPGEYKFFGEFHIKTAQGVIIAKENE